MHHSDIGTFLLHSYEALRGVIPCNLPDNTPHSTRQSPSPYALPHATLRLDGLPDVEALFL